MSELVNEPLVKRGEPVLRLTLTRGLGGLKVNIWGHKSLEDMMATASDGLKSRVELTGRNWIPQSGEVLEVYNVAIPGPKKPPYYDIVHVGHPLMIGDPAGRQAQLPNISYLKLVGLSEGITFTVRGVYDEDQVRAYYDSLFEAQKAFWISFMKPLDLTFTMSTQEM